jgi:antitoxin component of MazEF toxin-antitoxin module
MEKTFRTKVKKVGRSNVVILPKKMMDMLHWSDSEKVDVTPMGGGFLVEPSSEWSQEKQAEGIMRLTEEIMNMSPEEVSILPSGMEFVEENRRKIQPLSDFDRSMEV